MYLRGVHQAEFPGILCMPAPEGVVCILSGEFSMYRQEKENFISFIFGLPKDYHLLSFDTCS